MMNNWRKLCGLIFASLAIFVCSISSAMAQTDALTTVPAARGQAFVVYAVNANGFLNKIVYGNGTAGALLGEALHTGPWHNEMTVCSLSAAMQCDPSLPMLTQQGEPNPMAYNVTEAGVSDGQSLFQWADQGKASRFFAMVKQSANSPAANNPAINAVCEAQFLGTAPANPAQCKTSFIAICTSRQGVQQVARDNSAIGVGIENVVNICRTLGYH